jgi:peptidoglycan/LPS O-acetylase OafA/YrhL
VPGVDFGTVGVNLFFVLSGFLMGQLLFVKHTAIPMFYRRRVSRIIPAHVSFLLCMTVLYLATQTPIDWSETAAALFFLNNYFPGELGHPTMPYGHIWSLSVEEHSYILLSLVAIVSRQRSIDSKWIIAPLAACFVGAGIWYWMHYTGRELEFDKWLQTEVSAYGIFISTFLLLFFADKKIPRLPLLVYPALLALGLAAHWWSIPIWVRTTVGVGLFALTVNLLINAPDSIKRVLSFKPLRWLGIWSFSIYLWQQPFYFAINRGNTPRVVGVALAIAAGLASFYFVERPVRAYLNRTWGTRRAAPALSTAE